MRQAAPKIAALALFAGAALAIPAASANANVRTATASQQASGKAACEVETIRWYNNQGYKHVVLRNYCNNSRKVCVMANGVYVAGPKTVPGSQQIDWLYTTSSYVGTAVYYCQ